MQCFAFVHVLSPYFIYLTLFFLGRSRVLSHRGSEHPHILIKVAVLSLEIRGCIFKLSITPRLSGLREPVIQIRRCNLLRMAIPLHCTLASVSTARWRNSWHKGKFTYMQKEWYTAGLTLRHFLLGILNIYIFFILKKNMFIVKFHNQTEKNDLYILHHVLWSDLKPLIHFQTSSALKTVKPFGCFNMSHGFDWTSVTQHVLRRGHVSS